MKESKNLLYPLLIFLFSVVALGLSLFLYIYWYVEVRSRLQAVIGRFDLDRGQFLHLDTWVVIVILSILVGLILVGIVVIFIYHLKTYQLYRLQNSFINNFTHELKTPVTSIKLYLETFQKHELPRAKQLTYVEYMLSDLARLSAHINRILNLARIESGAYECTWVTVDLVAVVRDFLDKNSYLFANCRITLENPDRSPFLQAVDLPLFEILLMNLLTNASKYNDAPQAEVTISFTRRRKTLEIGFSDNGIGIERLELKKIFKKFYRGQGTGSSTGGSGLGLYLVERIAKIHKGRVTAASGGVGQGATFTLILPAGGSGKRRGG